MASPALAVVPKKVTLFTLQQHLEALADTADIVTPEQEAEFLREFRETLEAAKDKRDAVAHFLTQMEAQVSAADKEIGRLQKRKARFESVVSRMESYVLHVIMQQSKDAAGRYPKLEGNTFTFSARQNPPSVNITDAAKVPQECKRLDVAIPAQLWERVLDALPAEIAAEVLDVTRSSEVVVKTLVKGEIELAIPDWQARLKMQPSVGTDKVPGAAINAGTWRLVRE